MWLLSPSGWPTWADDDTDAELDLIDRGYEPIDEGDVQAAIDAYKAGAGAPPSYADVVTVEELQTPSSPAAVALRAAFVARLLPPTGTAATDTATIQTALDAAEAAGGGVVILPASSVWSIAATLTVGSNVTLRGQGPSTVLRSVAGLNAPVITNADTATGDTGIVLADMLVDGNRAQQTVAFSTIDMTRVSRSQFLDLHVTGALRTGTFPTVSSHGEGLVLRGSDYNEIRGGLYYENTYDGIKLRASNHNRITSVTCIDNGRSGIQLAYDTSLGGAEGTSGDGADHNIIEGVSVFHSTGVPAAPCPTTSGIYIHTGEFNTVLGLVVEGCRQGVGLISNASDNTFIGGTLRTRWTSKASIEIESGVGNCNRNMFTGILTRGLSGADGRHLRISQGFFTRVTACHFARGNGTGTWSSEVLSGSGNILLSLSGDAGLIDTASFTTVFATAGNQNVGFGTADQFGGGVRVLGIRDAATPPNSNPSSGGVLYSEGGALKWRGSSGTVTTLGPA